MSDPLRRARFPRWILLLFVAASAGGALLVEPVSRAAESPDSTVLVRISVDDSFSVSAPGESTLGVWERGSGKGRIGSVQVEIGPDRFRLATDGGGYIDVKIPAEVRENLRMNFDHLNEKLGEVLSDSMLEEIDRAVRAYTDSGKAPLQLIERLRMKSHHRKWKIIGSSVFKTGPSFTVQGNELVKGDVVLVGGDLEIDGKVLGKVVCLGGDVRLGPESVVEGDAVSLGGDVLREEGSSVGGKVIDLGRWGPSAGHDRGAAPLLTVVMLLLRLAVMAVMAVLLLAVMGDRMHSMCAHCTGGLIRPLTEGMFWLAAAVLVFAVLTVTLALTVIGIPVALLLGIIFGALLLSAYLISCRVVGDRLWMVFSSGRPPAVWKSILLGLIALELPAFLLVILVMALGDTMVLALPRAVDLSIKFLALSLGLGCVVRSRFGAPAGDFPREAAQPSPRPLS